MMETILVTGGAGFLGSNLCKKLLNAENRVLCLDNFYTGREENIKEFLTNPNFKLIEHDVINKLPEDLQVDQIYNLACPASPPHYQKDPVYTTKINVFGILNVLNLARKCNAKILQASTSEIYGEPKVHPQVEDYRGNVNPIGIRACYDEGKRCAESILFDYHRQYKTKIKVVRIFNTYGPNMDPKDGRVVSNFIMQALENRPITIYGEGSQTRSFCYVDDLLDGMIKMMNAIESFIGPVNIGNPVEYTVSELAKKIVELTKSKSAIIHEILPLDDPTQRRPDIRLAKNILSWQPQKSLDEGLMETIDYFRRTGK